MKREIKVNVAQMLDMLRSLKPKAAPTTDDIKTWWVNEALPVLKTQALSELHRKDEFSPCLVGFMSNGELAVTDVAKATGGTFGSRSSKEATAFVHKISAMVPGTKASVFGSEVWSLRQKWDGKTIDREYDKYPSLADHPDRMECVMFQMLHYDSASNTMMQLSTMFETIKVLGQPRHRGMWTGTTLAEEFETTDPHVGPIKMEGRFIYADDDFDDAPEK